MLKLNDLVPLNLEEEKAKFFASNFTYNPQFTYATKIDQQELLKYGKPKFWYLFLAKKILHKYKKNQAILKKNDAEREFLSHSEIKTALEEHLDHYDLKDVYRIDFSTDFVSRISVKNESKIIKVKLPVLIEKKELEATLAHEIDTHVLRQLNYEQQIWYKKKKRYGLRSHLRTEEGLAVINEMIASDQQLAYKTALNYLAIDLALKKDFASVFDFFYKFTGDAERSWLWAMKKKRGLSDTSRKGAFTKDVVYFEGFVEALNYLRKNNYYPSKLYYGKIDLRDIAKTESIGVKQPIVLPQVFTNDPDRYKKSIHQMALENLSLLRFL